MSLYFSVAVIMFSCLLCEIAPESVISFISRPNSTWTNWIKTMIEECPENTAWIVLRGICTEQEEIYYRRLQKTEVDGWQHQWLQTDIMWPVVLVTFIMALLRLRLVHLMHFCTSGGSALFSIAGDSLQCLRLLRWLLPGPARTSYAASSWGVLSFAFAFWH